MFAADSQSRETVDWNGVQALFMVNTGSRNGATAALDRPQTMLENAGMTLHRVVPDSREQAERCIDEYADSVHLVIAAGGDGTLNSIVQALVRHDLPLAILPLGTANDLARSLRIPQSLEDACNIILEGNRRRVDLGMVNGRYYFNVANIGLGTRITESLSKQDKQRFGVLGYLKALTAALNRSPVFQAEVTVDGGGHRLESIQIAVGNGRYYGGGNVVDEDASITDGELALYSVRPRSFLELLTLARKLRNGKHGETAAIFNTSGHCIEVTTDRTMQVHADGEPITETPARFEVVEQALAVLAPRANAMHGPNGEGTLR